MATTQLTLLMLGALATLATLGMFVDMDTPTQMVVSVVAAMTWAITANASLDVIVRDTYAATASEPVWSLVYLSAILALGTGVYAVFTIIGALGREAGATESETLIR